MAIVHGQKSDIGQYEYKCGDDVWKVVEVTNTKPLGKNSELINVVYLKGIISYLLNYQNRGTRFQMPLRSIDNKYNNVFIFLIKYFDTI